MFTTIELVTLSYLDLELDLDLVLDLELVVKPFETIGIAVPVVFLMS